MTASIAAAHLAIRTGQALAQLARSTGTHARADRMPVTRVETEKIDVGRLIIGRPGWFGAARTSRRLRVEFRRGVARSHRRTSE
jgi:hypothetical protein